MEQSEKSTRNKAPIGKVLADLHESIAKASNVTPETLRTWLAAGRIPDDDIRAMARAFSAVANSIFRASCFVDGIDPDTAKDANAEIKEQIQALRGVYAANLASIKRLSKIRGQESQVAAAQVMSAQLRDQIFALCDEHNLLPDVRTSGKPNVEVESDLLNRYNAR